MAKALPTTSPIPPDEAIDLVIALNYLASTASQYDDPELVELMDTAASNAALWYYENVLGIEIQPDELPMVSGILKRTAQMSPQEREAFVRECSISQMLAAE